MIKLRKLIDTANYSLDVRKQRTQADAGRRRSADKLFDCTLIVDHYASLNAARGTNPADFLEECERGIQF